MKHAKFALTAVAAAVALAHAPAYATNGYFLTGSGYRAQGMGGVGIAYGRDSQSIAANPANVTKTGMRGDMGVGVFNAEVYGGLGASADSRLAVGDANDIFGFNSGSNSSAKYFLVPDMGMTMNLSERFSVGMAVVGGGLATAYRNNPFAYSSFEPKPNNLQDDKSGVELFQIQAPLTFGYKINEHHSVGAAINFAAQRFRAYGLGAFKVFDDPVGDPVSPGLGFAITADPANLTNRGMDYSFGAGIKLGWLGDFLDDRLTVGLAYTSRTYMTKFDKYRGLFAEQGDFDIPENYGVGIALKPTKNLIIAADITRINYSDIASVGNRGPGTSARPNSRNGQIDGIPSVQDGRTNGSSPPASRFEAGNDEGMGFGWGDMTVYKLGVQYGLNKRMQLRGGYNYGKSPVSNDQMTFNILAPGIVEKHYSVGFTYKHSEELEITGTYVYVPSASQTSPLGQNVVRAATANMHQNVFGLSLGWVLDPGVRDYGDADAAPFDFSNFYLGLSGGHSLARSWGSKDFNDVFAASGLGATAATDNRSSAFKGYVGYQFNRYFGIEGGFVDMNDARASISVTGGNPLDANDTPYAILDHDAWFVGLATRLPVFGNLSLLGKLGVSAWQADLRVHDRSTSNASPSPTVSSGAADDGKNLLNGSGVLRSGGEQGYGLIYGLGVSYALADFFDVRAEWERFQMDAVHGVGGDVDLFSTGVVARF